jgi:integrase
MATQKFVLDTRCQRQDGRYPVIQRIYVGTRYVSRATGINLRKVDWDRRKQKVKSCASNSEHLTDWIEELRIEVQQLLLQSKFNPDDISQLKAALKGGIGSNTSFTEFGYKIVDDLFNSGRIGNGKAYRDALNKLRAYSSTHNLSFDEITYHFLYGFEKNMLKNKLKVNTIASYMRSIRAIYNLGIKHGVVLSKKYPFKLYRIKTEKTINKVLSIEELRTLYNMYQYEYYGDEYLASFFLSFCLIGMSFTDLAFAQWSDIQEARLVYKRRKTGKIYNIAVPDLFYDICKNMKCKQGSKYILPILDDSINSDFTRYNRVKNNIGYCNRRLKQISAVASIQKPVTTYYARYSWANVAKQIGISKDVISEALGHEYGNRVTGGYLDNFHLDALDEANRLVLNHMLTK